MKILRPKRLSEADYSGRWSFLLISIFCAMLVLVGRAAYLQILDRQFLQHQGDMRHLDVVTVPAHRGRLIDRNGELLAVSMPVKSVWMNPKELARADIPAGRLEQLAGLLGMSVGEIQRKLTKYENRSFVFLKRRLSPEIAEQATALGIPGIYADREYRRFYPQSEVTAHLLGFTNIDDRGQEGLELALDGTLRGVNGVKRILLDGRRRVIGESGNLVAPTPGKDVQLSIDQRLQYLAYRELKAAVLHHRARSGSLVLLDSQTGDVLAMVNQPSFNPNAIGKRRELPVRNRALTDAFEPGSTMKPFAVACALELGLYRPDTVINTSGGQLHVGRNVVKDVHPYGSLTVAGVIKKSSNVGVSRIALSIPARKMWAFYNNLGFGQPVQTGFPDETRGVLPPHQRWSSFVQATLSFGYSLSASTLQLARAYAAIANDGRVPMVSLLQRRGPAEAHRVMSSRTAAAVRDMLEQVVSREGTAIQAAVPGYRVAGKTGTAKKSGGRRGYSDRLYLSLFAGMAPASRPRLVMVVVIDEPSAGEYYGGTVAAPVFSRVMEGALRILNVPPDQEQTLPVVTAQRDDTA